MLLIGHDLYFTDYLLQIILQIYIYILQTMITFIVQSLQLTEGNLLANKFCSPAIATLNKKKCLKFALFY